MKIIRFKTTFADELRGCQHPTNANKIAFVEIPAPNNIDTMDNYQITTYVEKLTNLFVLDLEIIIKLNIKSVKTINKKTKKDWDRSKHCPGPGANPPCKHEMTCFCGMA